MEELKIQQEEQEMRNKVKQTILTCRAYNCADSRCLLLIVVVADFPFFLCTVVFRRSTPSTSGSVHRSSSVSRFPLSSSSGSRGIQSTTYSSAELDVMHR